MRLHDDLGIDPITMLLYGPSGSGKTWFAGTCGDRTLYINCGAGIKTLKSPLFRTQVNSNPIIVSILDTVSTRTGIIPREDGFDKICDAIDEGLSKYPSDFDTIVIDDGSSLSRHTMIKGLKISTKSKTIELAKANKEPLLPEVGDMGTEQTLLAWFFDTYNKNCKSAGKNLLVLVHQRLQFISSGKYGVDPTLKREMPLFVGKEAFAPDQVPGFFDYVWKVEAISSERNFTQRFYTQPTEIRVGKTRDAGVFQAMETNLTFPELINRVKQAYLKMETKNAPRTA